MANTKHRNSIFLQRISVIAAVIFSGVCWYFSNGLSGDFWFLLWLAPIPVLIISFNTTAKTPFFISFLAYLIGKLSWLSYLVSVATLVPAIIFTLIIPLFFSLVMIGTRKIVLNTNSWLAVFAFPVLFTTFEFLVLKFSPDGTAGSIAYSQSNFLQVIQVASVTGILGISFMLTFIPSAVAVSWHHRREKNKLRFIVSSAIITAGSVLLFGFIRLNNNSGESLIKVGLVVLDEKYHSIDNPDFQKEKLVAQYYAREISNLAQQGAALIVLPERAININKENANDIISILGDTAKQNHVFIITGYTNYRNEPERNSALVINAEGDTLVDYNKVHLVKGYEHQFTPGSKIGLFKLKEVQAGNAVCKELDFPDYIKKYGRNNVSLLCIPAWDFVKDDWLHSRMAVLRGVENGFSEIRTARQGRLTVSDCYGRVTYESNSSNGHNATLTGKVSLQKRNTFYTRFGDWFGIVNAIACICFIFFKGKNKVA
jgi:apolipoprotein N-acyltransferase